jgi:hypothetical protein
MSKFIIFYLLARLLIIFNFIKFAYLISTFPTPEISHQLMNSRFPSITIRENRIKMEEGHKVKELKIINNPNQHSHFSYKNPLTFGFLSIFPIIKGLNPGPTQIQVIRQTRHNPVYISA